MNQLVCRFCESDFEVTEVDISVEGFWCECCDGFTYFQGIAPGHNFTLILENKNAPKAAIEKPTFKFSKRISPLRYPGGKSKVIDYLYTHLEKSKTDTLVSPFTGGGSFELAMLEAGVVKNLVMNDKDRGIYSLWQVILEEPEFIIEKLNGSLPTHDDFREAQQLIKSNYDGADTRESAWATLLVNRLAYSGIYKANPLGGKNGSQGALLSRWNPKDLTKRINKIHKMKDRIEIKNEDACELIEEMYWIDNATIFIDPPYVEKGKDLYHCYYKEGDHVKLAELLDSLHHGCPGADIVLTYDYNEWLKDIYYHPNIEVAGTAYSI
ncbi:DNA adenine methylase [Shouchella clausii]|uniref:DNA adenine methylase n=1 Tax=Shouchella clausii TaxID=79880 RepID=UPI002DB95C25|nr:DNA adenine methylase [Shouchella clausii]MEB5480935.1 DNA adenine methylase [Shouchella clausii]